MTRVRRLIVVVGVEVSEVGVGVGFPGELRVEVLVPLLQHQVVFVEGLREQRAESTVVGTGGGVRAGSAHSERSFKNGRAV